jgi:hypothetical protein
MVASWQWAYRPAVVRTEAVRGTGDPLPVFRCGSNCAVPHWIERPGSAARVNPRSADPDRLALPVGNHSI